MRRAVLITNPAARRALTQRALRDAVASLHALDWQITIEEARSAGDTTARATHHTLNGVDAVLGCGGDGTLLAVANGVRAAGADSLTAVGVLPAGTANVWAAEAGVPLDPGGALALLEHGIRRRVDVGVAQIGDRTPVRFLLVCGVGLDAAVIAATEARPQWKRRLGRLAFAMPSLAALAAWPSVSARLIVDGEVIEASRLLMALAGNSGRYGGVATLSGQHDIYDGLLEVVTFEGGQSLSGRLALAVQAARGHLDERDVRGVIHRRAHSITITPACALPVEVDGDSLGQCGPDAPLSIEVEHRALTMIIGAG